MINQKVKELYQLVAQIPELTREYVENTIEPVREDLE